MSDTTNTFSRRIARTARRLCSMAVCVVDAKQVPVYGPYTAPSSRTMSRSTDWG